MWVRIYDDIGPPPVKPQKLNVNAYLMYQMDQWDLVKTKLHEAQTVSGKKAGRDKHERDKVRVEIGRMWNELGEEAQKPFKDKVENHRLVNEREMEEWKKKAAEWDRKTWEVKDIWIKEGNSFEEFCARAREEQEDMDGRAVSLKRESEGADGGSAKKVRI